jgi:hypothetical protein
MAIGTPVISHSWSGLGDFITEKNALIYSGQPGIVFDHAHPDPFLYTGMEEWFEPNNYQLMVTLRGFHDAIRKKENAKLTLEKIDELVQQGREDTRKFDSRIGGPKILQEIKRSFESWKNYGVVRPQDDTQKNEVS